MLLKYFLVSILLLIFGAGAFLLYSQNKPVTSTTQTISVTTSFYPLYFFASQIGGGKATVSNITPSGSEPHDYEPTTQDMVRIEKSKMLVLNGGVEPWGDKVEETLKGKNVLILTAAQGLLTGQIEEAGETVQDPHVWLSPILAKKQVQVILQGFETVDPGNKDYYVENADVLLKKLDELDVSYRDGLAACTEKDIITSHAAFGYLAQAYGLNQVAISGLSPDAEPSAKQLADVASFAKKKKVSYIFFESLVSPKLAETIAREVGAKTLVLDPLEGISDDSMKQGKNYFTVMGDNLRNLQKALQCSN